MGFLRELFDETNNINEHIVFAFIGLICAFIYALCGLFIHNFNIEILNSLLIFTASCCGVNSFQRIGTSIKENKKELDN